MTEEIIILTGGDTGANNLGDQWILDGVKNFYKKYLKFYKIIIMKDGYLEKASDGFVYIADNKEEFEKLAINIGEIKLVHYYGGGYLNDYWYDWKIWQCKYLLEKGLSPEKFIFTEQGIGPLNDKIRLRHLDTIASKASLFGLRDKNYLGKLANSVFMFDNSISLINPREVLQKNIKNTIRYLFTKKKRILINFRPGNKNDYVGMDNEAYLKFIKKLFKLNNNKRVRCSFFFFPMMENGWLSESNNFKSLPMRESNDDIKILNRPRNYRKLLKLVKNFDLVLTTSYHAALSGIYSGVPVIGIYSTEYYKDKFVGIGGLIKDPAFKFVQVNDFSIDDIINQLENGLDRKNINNVFKVLSSLKNVNIKYWKEIEKIICKQERNEVD